MSWEVLVFIIGRTSPSPYTFLLKDFFSGCGLQKPPGWSYSCWQSDLELIRQKMEGPQIIPTLCAPVIVHYLPRDNPRNWVVVFLPLHTFTCSLVVPRGSTCTENLALGHFYETWSTGSIFKAYLIIPVSQNLIWASVVHLKAGFWPLARCVFQFLKVLQPNHVMSSSRGSVRRRDFSQCCKNKGRF